MHIISMLLLPLLSLLSAVLCGASVEETVPTYERQDPVTGETLMCNKCPPGTHMAAHCTPTMPTKCVPCKSDHFTELWNYLPKCLYCYNFCFDNQEVEKECSAVSNRVCRCKQGFYWANDFCVRHSECEPGYGVKTRGTPQTDTVCEQCADGYFSNSSSALGPCVNHQQCASGQIVLLHGSVYRDTVCGTCEDLANGVETSRLFLSELLSMHRMRVTKMKKFVIRFIHKSGQDRRTRGTALPRERGPLLDQIRVWLNEAPEEELKRLPDMLRASQLNSMAEKLEKRVREIEQQSTNCTVALQ